MFRPSDSLTVRRVRGHDCPKAGFGMLGHAPTHEIHRAFFLASSPISSSSKDAAANIMSWKLTVSDAQHGLGRRRHVETVERLTGWA